MALADIDQDSLDSTVANFATGVTVYPVSTNTSYHVIYKTQIEPEQTINVTASQGQGLSQTVVQQCSVG